MPIDLYPNISKVKRNGAWQNLPGFIPQTDEGTQAMIASIETSTTAQYAHPKGSYFILNNTLYKADENIAVNDIIASGTNCSIAILGNEITNLEEELSKLNSVIITPEMFGAIGDGITDDTEALQDAFDFVITYHCSMLGKAIYKISDTLNVLNPDVYESTSSNNIINITGTLISGSFTDKPAIIFTNCQGWKININTRTSNAYGNYDFSQAISDYHYGALPNVGVVLRNCSRCNFTGYIVGYNVGLRLEGLNGGTLYNIIHNTAIWNCAYGIELYANTGGYVNNNRFDANVISSWSGITNREKAVAIHMFSSYGYANNCNIFEGDYMSANNQPAILIETGQYNIFFLRNEGSNKIICDSGALNQFFCNYNSTFVDNRANSDQNAIDMVLGKFNHIFSANAENINAVYWRAPSSGYYACSADKVEYGAYISSDDNFVSTFFGTLNPSFTDGYVPANLGVFIKLEEFKTIALKISRIDNSDIRYRVYLFDENKQLLKNPTNYLISGDYGGSPMAQNEGLTGGANSNKQLAILTLSDDVKYVFVTGTQEWSQMDVWVKDTQITTAKMTSKVIKYNEKISYPYLPLNNGLIKTSNPIKGKRLYSTVDGAEYYCSDVTDNVETWGKRTI